MWTLNYDLVIWTQPSGPQCLWQCLVLMVGRAKWKTSQKLRILFSPVPKNHSVRVLFLLVHLKIGDFERYRDSPLEERPLPVCKQSDCLPVACSCCFNPVLIKNKWKSSFNHFQISSYYNEGYQIINILNFFVKQFLIQWS